MTSSFEFLRPQENVTPDAGCWTPDAGQNPGTTKIRLPLRAGDKKTLSNSYEKKAHKMKFSCCLLHVEK